MPIVTIAVHKPKSTTFKTNVLESVYESLVDAGGAHPKDKLARLAKRGLDPEQVMVFFQDVPWETISTGSGRIPHA